MVEDVDGAELREFAAAMRRLFDDADLKPFMRQQSQRMLDEFELHLDEASTRRGGRPVSTCIPCAEQRGYEREALTGDEAMEQARASGGAMAPYPCPCVDGVWHLLRRFRTDLPAAFSDSGP